VILGAIRRAVPALALVTLVLPSQGAAQRSLVDPSQLIVPWPKHSHYKQPWRAWLETPTADRFLAGLGLTYNWNVERTRDDVEMQLLRQVGFSRIRIEVGWNNVRYETDDLTDHAKARLTAIAAAATRAGIRPLVLLNAHHGAPGPSLDLARVATMDAPAGSRELNLDSVEGVRPGYTGISNLTGFKMAEVIVTAVNPVTHKVALSKPLPAAIKAGQKLVLNTLKYRPLAEPGMSAYEETARGWLSYVRAVARTLREAGVPGFDLEIWNELTFGSDFVSAAAYYDPPLHQAAGSLLLEGGRLWELARRTIDVLAREFPEATPIWGFSNVTFFHTPIRALPPGTRGQSYHPYFFVNYRSIADEQYGFVQNLEQFAPKAPPYRVLMPEGAGTFVKTESLMRLLEPAARTQKPPRTATFDHFMTEFGFSPAEHGVEDAGQADLLRAKTVLRGSLFWLNKGLTALWFFSDFDSLDGKGHDLFPPEVARLDALPASPDAYLGLPLAALRHVTTLFRSGSRVTRPRSLQMAAAVPVGEVPGIVFDGADGRPPLTYLDVLATLPFQLSNTRFVVAVYVMTRNILEPIPPARFSLVVSNVNGRTTEVRALDSLHGVEVPVEVRRRTSSSVEIVLSVVDYPYLLDLREGEQKP
jgi:hypothetical protein